MTTIGLAKLRAYRSSHLSLLVSGLGLALMGGVTEWLSFPLSAPVGALAVTVQEIPVLGTRVPVHFSPGALYLLFVVLIVAGFHLPWRSALATPLFLSLLMLVYFPAYILSGEQHWMLTYLDDSIERGNLQRFLGAHFLTNKGLEPTLTYITSYQYLVDRIYLIWHMLGWGWLLAIFGTSLLALVLQMMGRLMPSFGLTLIAIPLLPAGVLALTGFSCYQAESLHHRGDTSMASGAYRRALQQYATALRYDPALSYSEPFLLKVSKAHYQLFGELAPYGQVYLASEEIKEKEFTQAELRLTLFKSLALPPSPFKEAIEEYSGRLRVQNYVDRGSFFYHNGEMSKALRYVQAALVEEPASITARFVLAKGLLDLNEPDRALALLQDLVNDVYQPSVKADVYSTIGDCYTKMEDWVAARKAYFMSYELDDKDNFRAVKELSGT